MYMPYLFLPLCVFNMAGVTPVIRFCCFVIGGDGKEEENGLEELIAAHILQLTRNGTSLYTAAIINLFNNLSGLGSLFFPNQDSGKTCNPANTFESSRREPSSKAMKGPLRFMETIRYYIFVFVLTYQV